MFTVNLNHIREKIYLNSPTMLYYLLTVLIFYHCIELDIVLYICTVPFDWYLTGIAVAEYLCHG